SRDAASSLGTSGDFTFTTLAPAAVTMTVSPTSVAPGGTVTVAIANGPGNILDWIALYTAGAPDSAYSDWKFLNGLRTAPATGVTSATVTFTMPSTSGSYTFRFFSNNTFTLLASANVTVTGDTAPPVISAVAA